MRGPGRRTARRSARRGCRRRCRRPRARARPPSPRRCSSSRSRAQAMAYETATESRRATSCAHQRDQVAAVVDGVVQRVEAADEQRGDADVDVVQQRLRDGLRACRRARSCCRSAPAALAIGVHSARSCSSPRSAAASSRCEPAFSGAPLATPKRLPIGPRRAAARSATSRMPVRALPRLLVGGAQDRAEGHADARRLVAARRRAAAAVHPRDLLRGLRAAARPRARTRRRAGRRRGTPASEEPPK